MVKSIWASQDERGCATGGIMGDQNNREVKVSSWYYFGQTQILRCKDRAKALIIAHSAETLANNNCIGYDQSQRTSLFDALAKIDFKYDKLKTKCETDCSALAAACCNCAGIGVSKNSYSGNIADICKATGAFEILTDSKYTKSPDYLITGDIVVAPGDHVIIMGGNGSKAISKPVSKPTNTPSTYVVKDGDTLTAIAQAHKTTVEKLTKLNKIKNPNLIHTGDKIKTK